MTPSQTWVLWDGDCGLCAACADWVSKRDKRQQFKITPYQSAPSPPMNDDLRSACSKAVHVVTPEGRAIKRGRAVLEILSRVGYPGPWRLLRYPPFIWLVELGYTLVAANRGRLGRFFGRPSCET